MYCITDEQIDFILSDIRRNGVETEDLQLNLLDHICCIVEQNLEEGEDFGTFYQQTVRQFYKRDLKEIEEETQLLLTFKNYYAMKKIMITSGIFSAAAFILGSFFKVMHWPGTAALIFLGILLVSFVVLPLMLLLKVKEGQSGRDKLVFALGTLTGMLYCTSTLFAIMHWPGRTALWISTVGVSMFAFIPAYFFTGIRRPETKSNTILTSILLVGATGLLFSMIGIRSQDHQAQIKTYTYVQNEQLLKTMQRKATTIPANSQNAKLVAAINKACEQVKSLVLENAMGVSSIPADIESSHLLIDDGPLGDDFINAGKGVALFNNLKAAVDKYNASNSDNNKLPVAHSIVNASPDKLPQYSSLSVLNSITQLQMYLVNLPEDAGVAIK